MCCVQSLRLRYGNRLISVAHGVLWLTLRKHENVLLLCNFEFWKCVNTFFIRTRKIALRLTVLILQRWAGLKKLLFCSFLKSASCASLAAYTACKVIIYITYLVFYTLWWIVKVQAHRFSVNRNYCGESEEIEYLWDWGCGRHSFKKISIAILRMLYIIFLGCYILWCSERKII